MSLFIFSTLYKLWADGVAYLPRVVGEASPANKVLWPIESCKASAERFFAL